MNSGKKAIILLAVLAILIGVGLLSDYVEDQEIEKEVQNQQERVRREQELIQIVKEAEIGDGVTLIDAVVAYCGTSGDWSAFDNTVFLDVYGDKHWIEAAFEVNEETEMVDVLEFDSDMHPANSDELENIFHDMILAAK